MDIKNVAEHETGKSIVGIIMKANVPIIYMLLKTTFLVEQLNGTKVRQPTI